LAREAVAGHDACSASGSSLPRGGTVITSDPEFILPVRQMDVAGSCRKIRIEN
jgi:hypothetical protein